MLFTESFQWGYRPRSGVKNSFHLYCLGQNDDSRRPVTKLHVLKSAARPSDTVPVHRSDCTPSKTRLPFWVHVAAALAQLV